jgi:hypothetical protein
MPVVTKIFAPEQVVNTDKNAVYSRDYIFLLPAFFLYATIGL